MPATSIGNQPRKLAAARLLHRKRLTPLMCSSNGSLSWLERPSLSRADEQTRQLHQQRGCVRPAGRAAPPTTNESFGCSPSTCHRAPAPRWIRQNSRRDLAWNQQSTGRVAVAKSYAKVESWFNIDANHATFGFGVDSCRERKRRCLGSRLTRLEREICIFDNFRTVGDQIINRRQHLQRSLPVRPAAPCDIARNE